MIGVLTARTPASQQGPATAARVAFRLGRLVATPGAMALPPEAVLACLARHQAGDWGTVSPSDWAANNAAARSDERIISAYEVAGEKLWIITEGDRSATTCLLPEEY